MTPPHVCCDPFKKEGHNYITNNLTFIPENFFKEFNGLYGMHVCTSCTRQLYQMEDSVKFEMRATSKDQREHSKEPGEGESSESEKDDDHVCRAVDSKNKRLGLASAFEEMITASPSKKLHSNLSDAENKLVQETMSGMSSSGSSDGVDLYNWLSNLEAALSRSKNWNERIALLTTVLIKWSIRKNSRELVVGIRMISVARRLHDDHGYGAHPLRKKADP